MIRLRLQLLKIPRSPSDMNIATTRRQAIEKSIYKIQQVFASGVDIPNLEQAKEILSNLASRVELFPRSDFPMPDKGQIERTFLIYQEENGDYGLYVNSSLPGQQSRPHDHGGSWAIVVAVEGEELHKVYKTTTGQSDADSMPIKQAGELTVKPGSAISMMPDGIHSIHAVSDKPLLHLHLYGKSFPCQGQRKEYDLKTGEVRKFILDDIGFIEDVR